ncbi:hypothetical protein Gotri_006391 [Gossypium trilobum]|uniref:RNase H type-1 domain-containing protein n=1 Tax=Gossypium trilobum TaxID=34281 RepID=A0A7J9F057_9ROSI|nr:hypothetical protein [Gossypium trilobum]
MRNNSSFLWKALSKIWPLFRDNLIWSVLETITRRIASIPPPHPVDGLNRISWAPNFKGNFSVKSAYWSLKEDHWNPKDPMWKSPWNFKGEALVRKHPAWFVVMLKKALRMFLETVWRQERFGDRISFTGGVIRNHQGNWIMGFNHSLGMCSVFYAKLWGILDGWTLLQDRDFNKISIHTNSLEVVHALQRSVSANSNSALVTRIQGD